MSDNYTIIILNMWVVSYLHAKTLLQKSVSLLACFIYILLIVFK